MMNADVEAVCGPRGRHDSDRSAVRHGTGDGSVTLGGRRMPVQRPRVRATDGSGELPVASYELFSQTEVLGRMAMARMLAGLSTRRYPVGLELVGRSAGREVGSFDEQVRGLAPVRCGDRDRAGRPAVGSAG
jgi:putative transposase